jgi:hypothetical protein
MALSIHRLAIRVLTLSDVTPSVVSNAFSRSAKPLTSIPGFLDVVVSPDQKRRTRVVVLP